MIDDAFADAEDKAFVSGTADEIQIISAAIPNPLGLRSAWKPYAHLKDTWKCDLPLQISMRTVSHFNANS